MGEQNSLLQFKLALPLSTTTHALSLEHESFTFNSNVMSLFLLCRPVDGVHKFPAESWVSSEHGERPFFSGTFLPKDTPANLTDDRAEELAMLRVSSLRHRWQPAWRERHIVCIANTTHVCHMHCHSACGTHVLNGGQ